MTVRLDVYARSGEIDWTRDFIWIQNTSLLKVLSDEEGVVEVMRHDGTKDLIHRNKVVSSYFPIRGGSYLKPIYAPLKAHILSWDMTVEVDGEARLLPKGSAILEDSIEYRALHADEVMRDYEAVSQPSDARFPELPFCR